MLNLSSPYQFCQRTATDVRFAAKPFRHGNAVKLNLTASTMGNTLENGLTEPHLPATARAFCQMAIACCEGTMEAATTPDTGITFHLYLAAVIDEPPPQSGSLRQHAHET